MTSLHHISRLVAPFAEEEKAARAVLGPEHPLSRAVSFQRTVAIQALAATIPIGLGVVGVLSGVGRASLVLGAACVVEVALLVASLGARGTTSGRAQELIAAGDDAVVLPMVARERRRLAARRERESLARSLERLLRAAQRWEEIPPHLRPLPGVDRLREAAPEVRDVVARLRAEPVRVQGVALVSRLLSDGQASPLYRGDARRLQEELGRIRYLLEPPGSAPPAVDRTRAAA